MATSIIHLTYSNPGHDFIASALYDQNGVLKVKESLEEMIKLLQDNINTLNRIKNKYDADFSSISDIDSNGNDVIITYNPNLMTELVHNGDLISDNNHNNHDTDDENTDDDEDGEEYNPDNPTNNTDHEETNFDRQKRLFNLLQVSEHDQEKIYDEQAEIISHTNKIICNIHEEDLENNSYVDATERVINRINDNDFDSE